MDQSLKIGFEAKRAFHNFRGLGNYGRTLIEGLELYKPHHKKILYTPSYNEGEFEEFTQKIKSSKIETPKGSLSRISPALWRTFLLSKQTRNDELDIFHGLSHELPFGIDKAGYKKVVTIHDLIFLRYPEFFPWIDRKIYLKKFYYSTQVSDKVLAICQQTKEDLMHFLSVPEEKIQVVYQSCHPRFYEQWSDNAKEVLRKNLDLPDDYLLYVGAFEKRKNVLSLIHAFARIKDTWPHDLVLVGNGRSYKKRMLDLISHYEIEDRVRIISPTNDELPGVYQMSSLFIFPSFFEGFGIPLVEALFSGVPIITSEGSCFPESAGPQSLYIDPNRVDQLTDYIDRVLGDKDLASQMSLNGREFAEKFHLKNTTQALENFYFSVINDKFVSS